MKVEILDGLGKPLILPATRIVVYDDFGNPVAFALSFQKDQKTGAEHIRAGHAGDKDFVQQLQLNGISKTLTIVRKDFSPSV